MGKSGLCHLSYWYKTPVNFASMTTVIDELKVAAWLGDFDFRGRMKGR